jgi:WD40 repeat protein
MSEAIVEAARSRRRTQRQETADAPEASAPAEPAAADLASASRARSRRARAEATSDTIASAAEAARVPAAADDVDKGTARSRRAAAAAAAAAAATATEAAAARDNEEANVSVSGRSRRGRGARAEAAAVDESPSPTSVTADASSPAGTARSARRRGVTELPMADAADVDETDEAAKPPKKSSALERARAKRAASRRSADVPEDGVADAAADGEDAKNASAGASARALRRAAAAAAASSAEDDETIDETEGAEQQGQTLSGTLRQRMGLRPLAVLTGLRRAVGARGEVAGPLGAERRAERPRPSSAPAERAASGASVGKPKLANLKSGIGATLAAMRAAGVHAVGGLPAYLRRGGSSDVEDLPPFERAPLFDDKEAALATLAGQLTSITIHRTDELPHDWRIAHPMIQVSIVNGATGHLLRKSAVDRPATTRLEMSHNGGVVPYLLPMLTKPFGLRGAATRLPSWEEELLFAEDFLYLLHPRVFLLFELYDFDPESREPGAAGMRPFAWAFLKPVSGPMSQPGHANLLRPMPLRLQLHRWQKAVRPQANQHAGWAQYLAAGRQPYSSTVYVTIKPHEPPDVLPVRFPYRPTAAHHQEEGRLSFERLQQETARGYGTGVSALGASVASASTVSTLSSPRPSLLANLPARASNSACLVPNEPLHTFPGGANGATAVSISPNGSLLAIALEELGHVMLAVHELGSGRRRMLMHAHHRTVHELCWSADGDSLLSVSADGTAKLWRLHLDESSEPPEAAVATLGHPSFVYCARMQPVGPLGARGTLGGSAPLLVLTGCNDCALRLWDAAKEELLAVKTEHKARINCITWASETNLIFSADAKGVVRQWELVGPQGAVELKALPPIEKKELDGVPINSLSLHPNRRRLLLQTRQNQILALDTRSQHFAARYQGSACSEYHVRASYSPDGRYVVAGSEDGRWYLWAEESGNLLLDGHAVGFSGPLLQIAWAPTHHVLAMCGYGANNPVRVYAYAADKPALDPRIDEQRSPPTLGLAADAAAAGGVAAASAIAEASGTAPVPTDRSAHRQARQEARAASRVGLAARLAASTGQTGAGLDAAVKAMSISADSALQTKEGAASGASPTAAGAGILEKLSSRRKAAAAEARARDGSS